MNSVEVEAPIHIMNVQDGDVSVLLFLSWWSVGGPGKSVNVGDPFSLFWVARRQALLIKTFSHGINTPEAMCTMTGGCVSQHGSWKYQQLQTFPASPSAHFFIVSLVTGVVLCSGPSPLWDDCEGLSEESSDDARTDSRVLCSLQDTGRVSLTQKQCVVGQMGHVSLTKKRTNMQSSSQSKNNNTRVYVTTRCMCLSSLSGFSYIYWKRHVFLLWLYCFHRGAAFSIAVNHELTVIKDQNKKIWLKYLKLSP